MANRVETIDGQVLSADRLSDFAFDLFQTEEHLRSSEIVARQLRFEDIEFKVAANFLFLKSLRVRKLSALRWLVSQFSSKTKIITSDHELDFAASLPSVTFVSENSFESFVSRKQAVVFACKVALHRMFRLVRVRKLKNPVVTRAWVEVTEAMYPDAFGKSHVLIYPFALNVLRQLKFIRKAFRLGQQVSLEGIPYSWAGLFLPFISDSSRFHRMITIETEGYRRHAEELAKAGVKTVRTSDEFEIAAVALYDALSKRGIESVNTAHGVGNYGPYQAYSRFAVLNNQQANFYRLRNPDTKYVFHLDRNSTAAAKGVSTESASTLILIHQNFSDLGLAFEDRVQLELVERLKQIAAKNKLSFFIKAHPNSSDKQIRRLEKSTAARIVTRMPNDGSRPIFLTLNSTAYFDFREMGPVLFFTTGTLSPEVYFGDEIQTVNEQSLQDRIESLIKR